MSDLTKIYGNDLSFMPLGAHLSAPKSETAGKASLDLLTGDRYEPKGTTPAAAPTYDEIAHRWGEMNTKHSADNPFETADGRSRPTEAERATEAAAKSRHAGDMDLLKSYNASALGHERGAEQAAAKGDIKGARRYAQYANTERELLAQHRPEQARMLGVEQPRYGSYNAFVNANAERDRMAFLHDNAAGKFEKAATFVPAARSNATFSARAMDSLKQFGKSIAVACKSLKFR